MAQRVKALMLSLAAQIRREGGKDGGRKEGWKEGRKGEKRISHPKSRQ